MQTLLLPASYEAWLSGLKRHLDRHRGSKAELARFLVHQLEIKMPSARVKVSELLSSRYTPSAKTFLDIAAWLQNRQEELNEPLPPLPARQEITHYHTSPDARPARVAESAS